MTKIRTIPYQRKGKTNYKKRTKLVTSGFPRLVIRPTQHHMIAQAVQYDENGDRVIAQANTKELAKQGWNYSLGNIPAAYLTGILLASRVKGKAERLIPDLKSKGARSFAVIKGVIDAGVHVPHDEKVFPSADRLNGKHISHYATKSTGTQFGKIKEHDLSKISAAVDKIKKTLMEGHNAKGRS